MGSGNLGLVYLMEEPRRLTLEEIDERHPALIPALREHPHVGFAARPLVRGRARRARRPRARTTSPTGASTATTRSRTSRRTPPHHLRRTDAFPHVADIMVGSFYDPQLDEGCAFEELISFHGGLGGWQTRAFILHPASLPVPDEPIVGAAAVHGVLAGWRQSLQGGARLRSFIPSGRCRRSRRTRDSPGEARAATLAVLARARGRARARGLRRRRRRLRRDRRRRATEREPSG